MTEIVRWATVEDVGPLARLNAEVQGLHAEHARDYFKPLADEAAVAAYFGDVIARDRNEIGICLTGAEPRGYIWIEYQERPETPFTVAISRLMVHHLSVTAPARRQGIGTRLMHWAEGRARDLGAGSIVLDYLAVNEAAHAFYARQGFLSARVTCQRKL